MYLPHSCEDEMINHDTLIDIFLSAGSIWFMIDTIWNMTHWSD